MRTAAEARRAYYRAVAANQIVAFLDQARMSAEVDLRACQEAWRDRRHAEARSGARARFLRRGQRAARGGAPAAALRAREAQPRARSVGCADKLSSLPDALERLPPPPPNRSLDVETQAVMSRVDLQSRAWSSPFWPSSTGSRAATRFIDALGGGRHQHDREHAEAAGDRAGAARQRSAATASKSSSKSPSTISARARTRLAEETYMRPSTA